MADPLDADELASFEAKLVEAGAGVKDVQHRGLLLSFLMDNPDQARRMTKLSAASLVSTLDARLAQAAPAAGGEAVGTGAAVAVQQTLQRMEQGQADFQKKVLEYMSDTSSHTIDATDVTDDDIEAIDGAMGVQREVVGPANLAPDGLQYQWLVNVREDAAQQKRLVMAFLEQYLRAPQEGFIVKDVNQSAPTPFPKASFSSMHRSFRGRADYLVVPARLVDHTDAVVLRHHAVIIFELKKALELKHKAQARLGHLIYGARAKTAILYVLSDLNVGGTVFYAQRIVDAASTHRLQVVEMNIPGVEALLTFLQHALARVDRGVCMQGSTSRPARSVLHLSEPERDHFTIEGYQHPQLGPAQHHMHVQCWDSDDDQDLTGFESGRGLLHHLHATDGPPVSMFS